MTIKTSLMRADHILKSVSKTGVITDDYLRRQNLNLKKQVDSVQSKLASATHEKEMMKVSLASAKEDLAKAYKLIDSLRGQLVNLKTKSPKKAAQKIQVTQEEVSTETTPEVND